MITHIFVGIWIVTGLLQVSPQPQYPKKPVIAFNITTTSIPKTMFCILEIFL